jgi:SAM-dependent methyltransferase
MAAMNTVHVDQGNVEQLRAWDGDEGAYWAAHPDRFDRSIAVHHAPFMRSAGIALGETVLDVGCGAGQTTIEAANANGGAAALGVDLSTALLDVARRRSAAAGAANARFLRADAQIHRFEPHSIDVVLARTSAMFFGDHSAAFANLRSATRDGGRIVLLTWQPLEHNEWLAEIAGALTVDGPPRLPPPGVGPFSLAEPARLEALLGDAAFAPVELSASTGPMVFGSDPDDAVSFILGLMGWMLAGLDDDRRRDAIEALRATCSRHQTSDGIAFASGAWITTATAA